MGQLPRRGVVRFPAALAAIFALGVVGIAAWYLSLIHISEPTRPY